MVEIKHEIFGKVGTSSIKEEKQPMREDDLKSLIELGCIKEEVSIDGKKFFMRSLSASERLSLADILKTDDPSSVELFEFNVKLLAMSVESVNGKLLENYHVDENMKSLDRKIELISAMQSPVLGRLLDFYNEISDRCDAQFTTDQVKN